MPALFYGGFFLLDASVEHPHRVMNSFFTSKSYRDCTSDTVVLRVKYLTISLKADIETLARLNNEVIINETGGFIV